MNLYEIMKVENCMSKSSVYQYRFSFRLTEEFINRFETSAEVKYHRNFPKPSFNITFADGTRIVGVLRDVSFKAYFPPETAEPSKNSFESVLTENVSSYETGE